MNGSARQKSDNGRPAHGDAAAPSAASALRVADDFPAPLAITDTELQVIERYLRGILDRVLCDENRESRNWRDARGALRPGLHSPPG